MLETASSAIGLPAHRSPNFIRQSPRRTRAFGTVIFSDPALAGQNLTLIVGDLGAIGVFALNATADEDGTVTVSSAEIEPGKRYGAVASSVTGEILAILFPVIGG